MVHIVDTVAGAILQSGQKRVGLLGTRFTMEDPFYGDRMRHQFCIDAIVPGASERQAVHEVIYNQLCHGVIRPESRALLQGIIERLARDGAEAVILGCTEIPLLISQAHSSLPVYDSTAIHAAAAVEFALQG
jgi:aspartate racemase